MIWEADMAVLAALSNICLAEDLSKKLEKDWLGEVLAAFGYPVSK